MFIARSSHLITKKLICVCNFNLKIKTFFFYLSHTLYALLRPNLFRQLYRERERKRGGGLFESYILPSPNINFKTNKKENMFIINLKFIFGEKKKKQKRFIYLLLRLMANNEMTV